MKSLDSLDTLVRDAVSLYWSTREKQSKNQGRGGTKDRGSRSAVTGGAQMDGFLSLLEKVALEVGVPQECIFANKRTEVPGYFRPTKEWDLLVVHEGALVAIVELKSHVGPSFGNNFNNRTEEALGSALDLQAAVREKVIAIVGQPWRGYLFLLEDCEDSTRPVKAAEPHFQVMAEFKNASYGKRYELFCSRLVSEGLYSKAALILSNRDEGIVGSYSEPLSELSVASFFNSFAGHLAGITGKIKKLT